MTCNRTGVGGHSIVVRSLDQLHGAHAAAVDAHALRRTGAADADDVCAESELWLAPDGEHRIRATVSDGTVVLDVVDNTTSGDERGRLSASTTTPRIASC